MESFGLDGEIYLIYGHRLAFSLEKIDGLAYQSHEVNESILRVIAISINILRRQI